jgi:hypothetical protein
MQEDNIVTYMLIAKQRLSKHVSVELDSWKLTRRCVIDVSLDTEMKD